jgi:hypothetical protein
VREQLVCERTAQTALKPPSGLARPFLSRPAPAHPTVVEPMVQDLGPRRLVVEVKSFREYSGESKPAEAYPLCLAVWLS